MPAPATAAFHSLNSSSSQLCHHDAHPRIYLSSRIQVAGDQIPSSTAPARSHTADMVSTSSPRASANSRLALTSDVSQDILKSTYRAATSKTAQRTLVNTVLLTAASAFLYALAAVAYILFYNAYLPDQVTVLPIHLQYGYGPNPYGVAPLSNMKDYQAYDVSVSLNLPASPANVDRGNFMIALYVLDKPGTAAAPPISDNEHTQQQQLSIPSFLPPPDPRSHLSSRRVLHASHRPALIPYTDPLASLFTRLLFLPVQLFFRSSSPSSISLTVPLVEHLSFPRSSAPSTLFLELQAGQSLRVASTSVTVTAQLSGLRWLMHRYRISAFLAGTTAFWACEVLFMGLAWAVLSTVFFPPVPGPTTTMGGQPPQQQTPLKYTRAGSIPDGEGDVPLSDTERTFPTTSRAPPLKYESVVKKEEADLAAAVRMAELPIAAGGDADDEDDEPGQGWRDSGIGTSYSDAAAGGVRRRASGKGR